MFRNVFRRVVLLVALLVVAMSNSGCFYATAGAGARASVGFGGYGWHGGETDSWIALTLKNADKEIVCDATIEANSEVYTFNWIERAYIIPIYGSEQPDIKVWYGKLWKKLPKRDVDPKENPRELIWR